MPSSTLTPPRKQVDIGTIEPARPESQDSPLTLTLTYSSQSCLQNLRTQCDSEKQALEYALSLAAEAHSTLLNSDIRPELKDELPQRLQAIYDNYFNK
jgi:hypothetical protein